MRKIVAFLIAFSVMLFPMLGHTGSSNAKIFCMSNEKSDHSIALSGMIPGDFAEFNLVLKVDGESTLMSNKQDSIFVINNFAQKVFTIAIGRKEGVDLLFYAIPSTLKYKENNQRINAAFSAIIVEVSQPGHGAVTYQSILYNVKMRCTYEYSF